MPQPLGVTLLLLVAGVALLHHAQIRQQGGHGDDFAAVLRLIDERAVPGDGVVFTPLDNSIMAEAYPGTFGGLHNVAVPVSAARTGRLAAAWAPEREHEVPGEVRARRRVWLIANPVVERHHPPVQRALDTLAGEYEL